MIEILLVGMIILLIILLIMTALIAYRTTRVDKEIRPEDIELAVQSSLLKSSDIIKGSMATSIKELKLDEDIGSIKEIAGNMLQSSQSLERMFDVKRGRAEFGEFQLEELLKDVLPEDRFGIRKKIEGVGTPDAHVDSVQGIVCIDSKFPLDNYRRTAEAENERERKKHATAFRTDVQRHIDKIADYIKPEKGTAEIAFGFIPSEAVYVYLVTEEQGLLRDGMKQGVHLVSPCTLIADLNLILTAIRAKDITERAEEIEKNIAGLGDAFDEFEGEWSVLTTHLSNAYSKMGTAKGKYDRLRTKYESIVETGPGD